VWASSAAAAGNCSNGLWYSTPLLLGVVQDVVWPQKTNAPLLLSARATETRGPVKGCGHRTLRDLNEKLGTVALTYLKLLSSAPDSCSLVFHCPFPPANLLGTSFKNRVSLYES